MIWEFETMGKPRPKGSLKCMGATGRGRHHMEEDNPESKPWKLKMIRDIRAKFEIEPLKRGRLVVGYSPPPYEGPVIVVAQFVFERQADWPSHQQPCPIADDIGDVDKLCRNVGDALEQSGLLANDRQITGWRAEKRWNVMDESARAIVRVMPL
jgi:hypothetical protein